MMDFFRRYIGIPLNDRLSRDRRLHFLPEIDAEYRQQPTIRDKAQLDRFWHITRSAYLYCPFYRELYDNACVNPLELSTEEDIRKLPVVSKEDIRAHGPRMLSTRCDPARLRESGTGGTTAAPIRLYLTNDCRSRRRAATLYFKRWFDYFPGDRQAYLWGAPQDFPRGMTLRWRLRNFLTEQSLVMFSSYLNEETMGKFCQDLLSFAPVTLQAYPTPLAILSQYILQRRLSIHIHGVNVAGEILYDHQRKLINQAFQTRVFNWYGARELGHIATECDEHNGLHVNTYGLYVEILKDGEPVVDDIGDVVVTDLHNEAMPFIRYRIGDLGVISKRRCPCGFPSPLIKQIVGRVGDVLRKRDGTLISGISFADRILTDSSSIEQLQVIQKDYELIELVVVKGRAFKESTIEEVKDTIARYFHSRPEFLISYVRDIPPEPSGKIRFVKCEIE